MKWKIVKRYLVWFPTFNVFFFFFIVENKLFILIIEEILNERMAEKLEKSKINMLQTLGETIFDYTRVISRENNVYTAFSR